MENKKNDFDIYKKAALSLGLRVGGVGLMLLAQSYLSRNLSLEKYGQYVYMLNWMLIIGIVLPLGFQFSVLKYFPEYDGDLSKSRSFYLFGVSKWLKMTLIFISLGLCFDFLVDLPHFILNKKLSLIFLGSSLVALNSFSQQSLRAKKKIVLSQIFEQILLPILLILISFLCFKNASLETKGNIFFIIHLSLFGVCGLFTFGFIKKIINIPMKSFFEKRAEGAAWLSVSISLCLGGLLSVCITRFDNIFIGFFYGPNEVALYSIASRVAGLLIFIPTALNSLTGPMVSKLYKEGKGAQITKYLKMTIFTGSALNIFIFAVILLYGEFILSFFGKDYSSAKNILLILALGQIFNLVPTALGTLVTVAGYHKKYFQILFESFIILILLISIGHYLKGVIGIALGTSSSLLYASLRLFILYYFQILKEKSFTT